MPIRFSRYVLLFIPFFLLFYSEALELGGMTISQLWKLPLLGYLIYYLFQYRRFPTPIWSQVQYWSSLKNLVNAGHASGFMLNMLSAVKSAFMPLLFNYLNSKPWSASRLRRVLLVVAQYFILTNVPFLLGMKAQKMGVDYGGFVAYSGIFQNQHAMSVIMAICIIVILSEFRQGTFSSRMSRLYNAALMLLGGYAMYLGFARTGWLMFLLAVMVLYIPRNLQAREWMGIALAFTLLAGGFSCMFFTNERFHDRLVGNDLQTHQKINFDSGRSEYIGVALERYAHGTVPEWLIGVSYTEVASVMKQKTGMAIGAHNGFVDMLVDNGMVGLFLMLLFASSLLAFIWQRRGMPTFRLAMAMWVMYMSFQATQGGCMFHSDFLYALIYGILEREYQESCSK